MTKEKKIYFSTNLEHIFDYLKKELTFIKANFKPQERFKRVISFALHVLYWQTIFKFLRGISILASQRTRLPFYIHKDKLEIEITTDCNMKCNHCDRSCPQAKSTENISLEQFKYFINESIAANKKWAFIVLIGGEPTLHPDIFEICELFINYKKEFSPNTKITISTNGVSTHTKKVLSKLPYIIHQENSNKKTSHQQKFDTFNVAPIDLEQYQNNNCDFSNGCNITSLSGTALTRYGFYPCGAAAGIDRVAGLDIGIKNINSRTNKKFRNQLNTLCAYCGHFKKEENYKLEDISPIWHKLYEKYKKQSPSLKLYGENANLINSKK